MKGVKVEHIFPIHSDERRELTAMFNGDFTAKQIKILRINAKNILGNHYHDYKETFYLLKGKAIYTFENIKTKERTTVEMLEGDRITIQPKIAHKANFLEKTIMIEGTEKPYISAELNDKPYLIND